MNKLYKDSSYSVSAIICGAGKGTRAKLKENKIFTVMPNGKSVLENALFPFINCSLINEIIITVNKEDKERVENLIENYNSNVIIRTVLGGETRTDSVKNALLLASGKHVIIHDGARPYIDLDLVEKCVQTAVAFGSAVACAPCTDTIAEVQEGTNLLISSSRENKMLTQTPQAFKKQELLLALSMVKEGEFFTDEAGVYSKYINKVNIVPTTTKNKKLTHPEDFDFYGGLKVGTGFDLHTLVENRKLILGGVVIPHVKGLLGHSDADVLTHAVMDALLSALALRDIGYHFSDKDPKYKDISSMVLLQEVLKMINEKSYEVSNLSAVIMAEKPKLSPYVKQITSSLASALNVHEYNVGITCTTMEKIGIIGREEGIAVQAYCLLKPIKG